MAKDTDDRLGWMELALEDAHEDAASPNGFYSVRELSFFKETFDLGISAVTSVTELEGHLLEMAEYWGRILATDHSRALSAFDSEYPGGFVRRDRKNAFKRAVINKIAGRNEEFTAQVRGIAFDYADQVEADYAVFKQAFQGDGD